MKELSEQLAEVKAALAEAFQEMQHETNKYRHVLNGFGQGHAMQAAAEKVAPQWLVNWYNEKRWLLALADDLDRLIILAKAFGYSEQQLLQSMLPYYKEQVT